MKGRPAIPRRFAGLARLLGAVLSFWVAEPARGDLAAHPGYRDSLAALADSVPAVAARKLQSLLEDPEEIPDPGDRKTVRLKLAEALVRAGRPEEALAVGSHESIETDARARFWKATALAALDRPAEAESLLARLPDDPAFPLRIEAALNRAVLLEAAGDPDAALAILEPMCTDPRVAGKARRRAAEIELARGDPAAAAERLGPAPVDSAARQGSPETEFLRARIALAGERADEAIDRFYALANAEPGSVPVAVRHAAFLGEADAHAAAGKPDRTAKSLFALASRHPDSPLLEPAFQRLERYGLLKFPDTGQRLRSWSRNQTDHPRKALATFYLGLSLRDSGRTAEAIDQLELFRKDFPDHPLADAAALEMADLLVESDRRTEAAPLIGQLRSRSAEPDWQARLDSLEARADFSRGEFQRAAAGFAKAAGHLEPGPAAEAAFNAAVASLRADDAGSFEKFATLLQRSGNPELSAELMLEQGLHHAANADTEAFESLEEFLRLHGNHSRAADARLALAELYLNQVPAQSPPARDQLEAARAGSLTAAQRERLDYVAVWIELGSGDDRAITAAAGSFVEKWKESDRRPSVLMILGEAFYRMQDYANAITYFEKLAEEAPESEFAQPALFFAAKAASLTLVPANQQFAIETWARVAETGGPLEAPARHEQGLLKLTLDQVDDAVAAFDSILAMEIVNPELRIAALCDKGQALFTKGTASRAERDTESLETAIAAFETVENDPAAARSWKYQAAVRRGNCLEALGRNDEALEVYYDIIRSGGPLGPVASVPVEEFDWFFRAGIAAIQLLQQQENWEAAVRVADRLAQAGGPRAVEAANLADRLRLRHFIWDDPEE